ncbi:MAG: N-sulfoglucosamine sulfohydrolase, partial [Algoriphagus sp.]
MNPSLIKISFFILLVSFACKIPQKDANATLTYPERPNIVWIVAEDLSPQHLGAYGGTGGKTSFLDSLAAEGVHYSHAYSTAGVCAPSRAALITGAYQTAVGGHNMRTLGMSKNALDAYPPGHQSYSAVIPADMKTYPELLRMAGYYTSNNSKEDYQFRGPVTMWDESSNKAHWRNRKDSNQPFFSIFNLNISHESQVWARADEPLLVDPADVFIPPYYPDDSISRAVMARFITNAMRMDMQAGEIIKQLKDDGLYDNTIIFFYGDHGDGMPYAKRELYDRGLKVPLIIKAPFLEKGGQLDELVSFVDFAPTVLSLAGVEVPKSMQGQAFLGSQKAETRKYI